MNWYLWSQQNDPNGEIAWLEGQLSAAEKAGEKVFIIGHIPPADGDCLHSWSNRYRGLFERYQHVIRMQLYGHTHDEDWHLHRGFDDGHPLGMQWVSGSLGPTHGKNPSFRIFELDAETMLPVEIRKYVMNLTDSNYKGEITWEKMFDTTEEYGLKDLAPSSIFDFVSDWTKNVDGPKKYIMNKDARYIH